MILRLRDWLPVPHDWVHVVQAENALAWQWIGHGPWSHARVSAVCAQAAPPCVGCVLARVRDCEPAPHDVVHVDQAPKLGSKQSTGHVWVLQSRVSAECGHALPPSVGAVVERLRFCEPVPHDLVQVDQAPKVAS